MRTTSKKKQVTPTKNPDKKLTADSADISPALDALCNQWLVELKDRDVASLEELVLVSSLAALGSAKQWKVVAQVLLLALKVAKQDPSVAETLRGAVENLFGLDSAGAANAMIDGIKIIEGDRVFIQKQRLRKNNGVYKARVKKGPRK